MGKDVMLDELKIHSPKLWRKQEYIDGEINITFLKVSGVFVRKEIEEFIGYSEMPEYMQESLDDNRDTTTDFGWVDMYTNTTVKGHHEEKGGEFLIEYIEIDEKHIEPLKEIISEFEKMGGGDDD